MILRACLEFMRDAAMLLHPHPVSSAGQALNPLPSRERRCRGRSSSVKGEGWFEVEIATSAYGGLAMTLYVFNLRGRQVSGRNCRPIRFTILRGRRSPSTSSEFLPPEADTRNDAVHLRSTGHLTTFDIFDRWVGTL